ncbi:MAG TPA: hypothetical protein DGT23_29165 [Micromonosporaceae bacterium]|nr:hypothetical protein [Micromonosporaceae bacterium]
MELPEPRKSPRWLRWLAIGLSVVLFVLVAYWAIDLLEPLLGHRRRGWRAIGGAVILILVAVVWLYVRLWDRLQRRFFPGDRASRRRTRKKEGEPVNTRMRWTVDEERTMLDLHATGSSNRAIGKQLGRSTAAVQARVKALAADGSRAGTGDDLAE